MALISAAMANLYDARIRKVFNDYLLSWPEEYSQWCDVQTSTRQYEKNALFGELPMPGVLGEYENAPEAVFKSGPVRTWTHVKYGFKIIASEECIEDDLFSVVVSTAQKAATAMRHRMEVQGAYDLNSAFTVSTVGPSDTASETLIATSHATFTGAGGASQANRPSTDVTLGPDSLWAAIDNFGGLKDHEGNPIMAIPRTLIAPVGLKRTAIEILKSTDMPYKSTFELNALRMQGIDFTIGHYLTGAAAWFVTTDQKAIRFYIRRAPVVKPDVNITNDSRSWTITARLSHAPYDWYQIYGTDGVA